MQVAETVGQFGLQGLEPGNSLSGFDELAGVEGPEMVHGGWTGVLLAQRRHEVTDLRQGEAEFLEPVDPVTDDTGF